MPTPIIKGLTTIKWGSGDTVSGAFTNAIVARVNATAKNGQAFDIEDNDGFSKAFVFLDDGFDGDIECVYDSAIAWPTTVGSTIALKRPTDAAAINCFFVSMDQTKERKKEAMITMKISYRPGVDAA